MSPLKIGSREVKAVKIGSRDIVRIMLGTREIWEAGGEPGGAVAFVGVDADFSSGTVNSRTVDNPGAVTGDYLILALALGANVINMTPPSGFSPIASIRIGSGPGLYLFEKIAGGLEPASYTVSWSGFTRAAAAILAYRGVDSITPISDSDTVVDATANANRVLPSVDGVAGGMLVAFYTAHDTTFNQSWTHPTGMNARVSANASSNAGSDTHLGASDEALASAGATGARTAVYSRAEVGVGWMGVLNPA